MKRFLRDLASLLTHHPSRLLLLTALIAPSCGGDDKKTDTSPSGSATKARIESSYEQWHNKSCETHFACGGALSKAYDSVQSCQERNAASANKFGRQEGGYLAQADSCYAIFIDSFEACKNAIVATSSSSLCKYFTPGSVFLESPPPQDALNAFPDCAKALADMEKASAECGGTLVPAFFSAPSRESGYSE